MAKYTLTERDAKRFWSKVRRTRGCWTWTGSHFKTTGYALFNVKMSDDVWRPTVAHRVAYELAVGQIPEGLHIDHLCRNRGCVRPEHLEPVTPTVNKARGESRPAQQARWTHCPKGHPFDEKNTYIRPSGKRECRACMNERGAARVRSSGDCLVCGTHFTSNNRNIRTCGVECGHILTGRTRRGEG